MTISFNATKADAAIITQIANRAADRLHEISDQDIDPIELMMDLTAAHLNGCPLDLERLFATDNANLAHDVFGIRRHLNRETGEIKCFLPRFAQKTKTT